LKSFKGLKDSKEAIFDFNDVKFDLEEGITSKDILKRFKEKDPLA